jgi:hypothetical protein
MILVSLKKVAQSVALNWWQRREAITTSLTGVGRLVLVFFDVLKCLLTGGLSCWQRTPPNF